MIHVPIEDIIKKVSGQSGLSEKEVKVKIKEKMSSLKDLVSEEGAAYIIASELNVKLFEDPATKVLKINEAHIGMTGVEIVAKVTQIFETRNFQRDGRTVDFVPIMIADETGQIRTTLWDRRADLIKEDRLNQGDVVRIKGAAIKDNKYSGKELQLTSRSQILINQDDLDVKLASPEKQELQETSLDKPILGSPVKIRGTIVNIAEPRFYDACPECRKKVAPDGDKFRCLTHELVKANKTLIFNFVIDDSKGNIRATCFGESGEKILGMSADKLHDLLLEKPVEEIAVDFLGSFVEVQGSIRENKAYDRTELSANSVNTQLDPKKIAEQMLGNK
jgi:replication factor A1